MITPKERKLSIIKYLEKNPLSSPRQIRTDHSEHEYHSKYLKKFLDELINDKKIDIFLKKYYAIPKAGKEINLLINIIKTAPLHKPTFKKLKFIKTKKNPTLYTIINNCICLYHLKLKINKLEKIASIQSFDKNFIKFLKSFSDDNYYTDFMVDKNFFKKNPIWKKMDESNNTLKKRISSFLRMYWNYSSEYLTHLKSNKIPLKELFHRVFELYNTDRSVTASKFGTTNKALKFSLESIITEKGVLSDSTTFDSEFNRIQPKKDKNDLWHERSRIISIGIGIMGNRLPSTRKKQAKIAEENSGIPFTKLIPMKGYSNLLKDAPTEIPKNSAKHPIGYYEFYEKTGMPPLEVIDPKTGERFYQSLDPTNPGKWNKEWEEIK